MKSRAKQIGKEWGLDEQFVRDITTKDCYYCGKAPMQRMLSHALSNGAYIYNGIDRLESSKGYVAANVVPCCVRCNQGKNNMSKEEFFKWIERIYQFRVLPDQNTAV